MGARIRQLGPERDLIPCHGSPPPADDLPPGSGFLLNKTVHAFGRARADSVYYQPVGFFDRIRHPVSGTATVTAATEPTGMRSPQEARMTLTVHGMGFDAFTIEHEEKCHTDRWPKAGMALPVVFDSEHHERMEVQWDDVRPFESSGDAPPAAAPPAAAPPASAPQDIVDQITKAFPDAQVSTHVETKVVDLSANPEAARQMIGSVEAATGMDIDGDGRIGGSAGPPPASAAPPAPVSRAPSDDTVSRLERLAALHKQGVLTDEEFAQQKKKLLGA
jgi:hypothetical protein